MLRPQDDPSKISYSFTLMERKGGANLVRVQTDSFNQPFDISRSGRLNLGSTAKLRTVITYLQIVAALHARYGAMSAAQLRDVTPDRQDALTRWALDYLAKTPDRSLPAMLDAAVAAQVLREPRRDLLHGRRRADLHQLRGDRQLAHAHRGARVPAFGESGVRAPDARYRPLRDGQRWRGRRPTGSTIRRCVTPI